MAVGFLGSRFVGRAEELGRLRAVLQRVEGGTPATVLVAGDAGIGKSRLLTEFCGLAEQRGAQVLVGGCLQVGGGGLPYVPVVIALRRFAAGAANEELLAAAAKGLPGLERLLPELAGLTAEAALEGGLDQIQLFDSIRALLVRLSEGAPVLMVVEDLHWTDRSTRDLLAFLGRTLHGRVALVMSYRSDGLSRTHPLRPLLTDLAGQSTVERLELASFDRAELAEHLAAVKGQPLEAAAVDRILGRSEGNPFYAEELLAAGADEADVRLPSTLADVLLARVDRLSGPAQQLLGVVAVAGRRVSHRLLAEVIGQPDPELEGWLHEALAAQLLVADAGSETYAFRHALLQEAVYGDLLPGERIRLHRAYVRLLAGSGPAAELAYHCLASHELAKALAALVKAAADATAQSAPAEAFRHLSKALDLWDRVPDPVAVAGVDRVDLLFRAAEAANQSGAFDRAVGLARQTVDAVDADAAPLRAAQAYERLGHYLLDVYVRDTPLDEMLNACSRAVELVPNDPPTPLRARVIVGLADALLVARQFEQARRWGNQALALARAVRSDDEAHALVTLGLLEQYRGEIGIARALLGKAHGQAAVHGNRALELVAQNFRGALELEVGNLGAACVFLNDAAEVAEANGLAWSGYGIEARELRCIAHYTAGNWDEAERLAASVDDRNPAAAGLSAVALFVEVGRGRPSATQRLHWLATLRGTKEWFIYLAEGCAADLACWEGDPDRVRALIRSILDRIEGSSDWTALHILRPAALGLAAEADRAKHASTVGDKVAQAESMAVGEDLLARMRMGLQRARDCGRQVGPEALAWLAKAYAERTRLVGSSDPDRWSAAVDAFSYGYVYEVARCQWRLAEALLGVGDRQQAAVEARAAYQTALQLEADPLRRALEVLARQGRFDPGAPMPTGKRPAGLTAREVEVLRLLVEGYSNRKIARALFISEKTASVHVSNIINKLGVRSRLEAAARARKLGLDD